MFPLMIRWGEAIEKWAAPYQMVVWDPRDRDFLLLTDLFEPGILNLEGIGRPNFLALLYAPDDYEWKRPLAAYIVVDEFYTGDAPGWSGINDMIGIRCLAVGVEYARL